MILQRKIQQLYQILLDQYGPQGWWPLSYSVNSLSNDFDEKGYHHGIYGYPTHNQQKLEICLGAILTQNTQWMNVIKALNSLRLKRITTLDRIREVKNNDLALAIKSAGYYNQKAKTIKNLTCLLDRYSFQNLEKLPQDDVREKLLNVKGIGPETADCILLYALKKESFVIDSYTKRILLYQGVISEQEKYNSIKQLFESSLKKNLVIFQEYHALLVQHGKKYYSKKPYGIEDAILRKLKSDC